VFTQYHQSFSSIPPEHPVSQDFGSETSPEIGFHKFLGAFRNNTIHPVTRRAFLTAFALDNPVLHTAFALLAPVIVAFGYVDVVKHRFGKNLHAKERRSSMTYYFSNKNPFHDFSAHQAIDLRPMWREVSCK